MQITSVLRAYPVVGPILEGTRAESPGDEPVSATSGNLSNLTQSLG